VRIPEILLGAVFLMPMASVPGVAQATLSGNVTLSSAYVWRGVTNTNRPVIQPDVTLDVPLRSATLTLGAWASIEPARYDGPADISAVYGLLPGPAFTQYSVWAHVAGELPGMYWSGGAETYLYPAVADLAALYNTVELTASASLALPLSPSFTVWYDVGAVRGAYLETSVSLERDVRSAPVSFDLSVGLNVGQGPDASGRNQSYFARKGATHLELAASTEYHLAGLVLAPTAHVIHGVDPLTRVTSPATTRSTKLWIGTTLSWSSSREGAP
jgi:hypothetical protein